MPYITHYQLPVFYQPTWEEIIYGTAEVRPPRVHEPGATHTHWTNYVNSKLLSLVNIPRSIDLLRDFNTRYADLIVTDKKTMYDTFHIPKRSGGLREINSPHPELMKASYDLIDIIRRQIFIEPLACHHTAAFAYVKKRSVLDVTKKHQRNNSWWFLDTDFSDFFRSTTMEFLLGMMSIIFPLSEIMKVSAGREELRKALSICFLRGGLPQGNPASPFLTNLMMIPIDHSLNNSLSSFNKQTFVYARYADDIKISSRYNFQYKDVISHIEATLKKHNAPFKIKPEKTLYHSRAGSNWMLGMMLNKDNNITIGSKNKRRFQAMITNYIMDRKNGIAWDPHDIYSMSGYISHYNSIEPDFVDKAIRHANEKFGVNVRKMIKEDLGGEKG